MSISGHRAKSAYRRHLIGSERRAVAAGTVIDPFHQAREKGREVAENESGLGNASDAVHDSEIWYITEKSGES